MALGVTLLVGVAGWLMVGAPPRPGHWRIWSRTGAGGRVAVLAGVMVACWWAVGGGDLVLVAIMAMTGWVAIRRVLRARAAAVADRRTEQVLLTCEGMAADLSAGQPPLTALDRAAAEWPEFVPVAIAGRLDADVPSALRLLAEHPGGSQLRTIAAAWQVAHRSGAGLATALSGCARMLREDHRTLRLVAAELAAARATARMMAVLPVLVLLLGAGLGGDPIGFLTGTPVGLGLLGTGLGLTWAGLVWLDRIAAGVLRR